MAKKKDVKKSPSEESQVGFGHVLEEGEMLDIAYDIAEIEMQTAELKKRRDELTNKLVPAMQARNVKCIPVPDLGRSIDLKHDKARKLVTKNDVVKEFGEQGETFWESRPRKDRWYLSVAKNIKQ